MRAFAASRRTSRSGTNHATTDAARVAATGTATGIATLSENSAASKGVAARVTAVKVSLSPYKDAGDFRSTARSLVGSCTQASGSRRIAHRPTRSPVAAPLVTVRLGGGARWGASRSKAVTRSGSAGDAHQ